MGGDQGRVALFAATWLLLGAAGPPAALRSADGLRLVVTPEEADVVSAALVLPVGSMHGPRGIPHFVEHLVFQSRDATGERLEDTMRRRGCAMGAETWPDRTEYRISCPGHEAELVLETVHRIVEAPLAKVTEDDVRAEAGVITAELQQDRGPAWREVTAAIVETLGRPSSPEHRAASKAADSAHAVTLSELAGWADRSYTPAGASLAVVGAVDPLAVRSWAERTFGSLSPLGPAPTNAPSEPSAVLQLAPDTVTGPTRRPAVIFGWPIPSDTTEWEREALSTIVELAMTDVLESTAITVPCAPFAYGGLTAITCQAELRPGDSADEHAIALQYLVRRDFAPRLRGQVRGTLASLRSNVELATELVWEDLSASRASRAVALARLVARRGHADLRGVAQVTAGRARGRWLERQVKDWITPTHARFLLVEPSKTQATPPDRPPVPRRVQAAVAPPAPGAWSAPEVARRQLPNGIEVVAVRTTGGLSSVSLRFGRAEIGSSLVLRFMEEYLPPRSTVSAHKGVVGFAETSGSGLVIRAWARAGELDRALDAAAEQLERRAVRGASVEPWIADIAQRARDALAEPDTLARHAVGGGDPGDDPLSGILEELDLLRGANEILLLLTMLSGYALNDTQVLVTGPEAVEDVLDRVEKRLTWGNVTLARDDAERDQQLGAAWVVPDPTLGRARLLAECDGTDDRLTVELLVRVVRRRLWLRFRHQESWSYSPTASVDGGTLRVDLTVPPGLASDGVVALREELGRPLEPVELAEARAELVTDLRHATATPTRLPGWFLRVDSGLLPSTLLTDPVQSTADVDEATLQAELAACADARLVVQGPVDPDVLPAGFSVFAPTPD